MGFDLQIKNLNKKIKKKTILNNINLNIKKDTFTAIVGVSGAGKTSLLNAISNYDTNYQGQIYYNNYNIKKNDLRKQISYVPQSEILHQDLTLYKELYYSAKLRIKKSSKKNINKKINELIQILELQNKEKTKIKNLSGGEKKRLSIGIELLNNPKVLILDEPTSGLDLNVEKKIMETLKKISKQGTTVIVSLHTVSNLNLCDEIVFMGQNGSICYQGPYNKSIEYFKVKNFVDIYELLQTKTKQYNDIFNQNIKKIPIKEKTQSLKSHNNILNNILTLSKRYIEIIWKDKLLLFMLMFQGFILALLTNLAIDKNGLQNYDVAKIALFATTCAALWTGIFNSIQEVVKERNIVKKEYISGINISSYIISKLIVLFLLCLIQSLVFISTLYAHFKFVENGLIFTSSYIENVFHYFIISYSSSILGLFISSIFKRQEITLIIATIYMMLQLIMSGVLLKLKGIVDTLSHIILGRYAMEAFGTTSNLINVVKTTKINGMNEEISITMFLDEAKEYYTYTSAHIINIWVLISIVSLILIILTIIVLHQNIKNEN